MKGCSRVTLNHIFTRKVTAVAIVSYQMWLVLQGISYAPNPYKKKGISWTVMKFDSAEWCYPPLHGISGYPPLHGISGYPPLHGISTEGSMVPCPSERKGLTRVEAFTGCLSCYSPNSDWYFLFFRRSGTKVHTPDLHRNDVQTLVHLETTAYDARL